MHGGGLLSWSGGLAVGHATNGLTDTLFLGGITQAKFAESLHQFVV